VAALEQRGSDLDVAHFAYRGYFDSSAPLKSGIVLAAESNVGDTDTTPAADVLTAEQLLELEIGVTLLTLSACETGINERRPGDELIGLTRSLIYAGAPSVVVSLWTVDDLSTRLLMERFYQCLHQSLTEGEARFTKAKALQKTRQHVRSLTAQEIFEWSDSLLASAEPDVSDTFSLDRAEAQALAGDVEPALAACLDIRNKRSDAIDEQTQALLHRIDRMVGSWRSKTRSAPRIDYEVRPFDHLFYWAPFVLVGDWK
jgi:CHAT domain-containing protein